MDSDRFTDIPDEGKRVNYGGFWIRLVAFIIDTIVLVIIGAIVQVLSGPGILTSIIGQLVGMGYYVFLESGSRQATVGKMVLDLKVVDLNYQRISVPRAFGRYLAKSLAILPMMIGYALNYEAAMQMTNPEDLEGLQMLLAGSSVSLVLIVIFYGMAAFHPRKQALHDRLASTYIIRTAGEPNEI